MMNYALGNLKKKREFYIDLNTTNPDQSEATRNFLNNYKINLSVDDFVKQGVLVKDRSGRTVGVAYGELRDGTIHTGEPYADVMVISLRGGVLAGWIHKDKMVDADDRFLVKMKSLSKLPKDFDFVQECPHLSVYGGVFNDDEQNWECLGCGKLIIC